MTGKELKRRILRRSGMVLLPVVVAVLIRTLKIRKEIPEQTKALLASGDHYLLAFWHGNMLLAWYLHRSNRCMGLTSKSKDGDLLATLLKKWGYYVARGSSSQGGKVALGVIVDYLKHEGPVALTPDGPRGPARELKAGTVIAAQRAGVPVIFLGIGYKKKRLLRSWDKFEIPAMFTETTVIYSEPFFVDPNSERQAISAEIKRAETVLNSVQEKADKVPC